MGTSIPLVFRPNGTQRLLAALLCLGSWLVGIRALAVLLERLPWWMAQIRHAEAQGDPVLVKWLLVGAAVGACVAAGIALLMAILALLLIEGCQVVVDDLGLSVDCATLPQPLARRLGAGRLAWRQILDLEKRGLSFRVRGNPLIQEDTDPTNHTLPTITLRFLMVDELERLLLIILERSPNLR